MSRASWAVGGLAVLLAALAWLAPKGCSAEDDFKVEKDFTLLFNGKDLTGWRYPGSAGKALDGKTETPDGRIKVQGGAIVMLEKDREGKGGIKDLYTVKVYDKPFHLRLEFRAALKADSGVYVRGPQLQVRDFIRRNEHRHLKKFKNDGWNQLDIVVRDGVLITTVNGHTLTDKDDLEVTVKDGKSAAKLNGKAIDVKSVSVRKGSQAICTCNGERLETMYNIPGKGGIGLQAETGKFEFRRIRVKVLN
jgi:hypothetical protein